MKMTSIPPVALVLIFAIIAWIGSVIVPIFTWQGVITMAASVLFAVLGLTLIVWSVVQFRKAKTSVDPMSPDKAQKLMTNGFYNISRNPMYLGMAALLLAWAIFLGAAIALVGVGGFVLWMSRWQIPFEEAALTQRFGDDFETYKSRVRRWV